MRALSFVLFAAVLAVLSACASRSDGPTAEAKPSTASSAIKSGRIEVTSAQFGVFGAVSEGHRILFETDRFPAVVAAPYGWYIIFKTNKPTVVWREEFELPVPLDNWGPGEALGVYTISPDRKTAVTERVIPARLGFIANEWRYAPGDPIGAHAMRIYIDGQLIREFKFNIEDGPGHGQRQRRREPST
jgi:hypothetical protein